MSDLAALKQRAREAWDGADYGPLGERLMPAARELVDACAVSAGQEMLDVAAGTGNAAAVAAAEGARAVASDFSPKQVERGRARTEGEGLDVEWTVADVEELPFEDASFDCVLSVFGAQFAPRPDRVAAELFRVVRPGGTVGMANWPNRGFQSELFETLDRYAPNRPAEFPNPRDWGENDVVHERFDGLAGTISVEQRMLPWEFDSFVDMATLFRNHGPRGMDEMPEDKLGALVGELQGVVERWNSADDGSIRIGAEYTLVVARKRG
ncbi:MAG TPA: class I SAM-dependent methyltransferase [Thermoleophilaceae bacterium]|nr:class I SAM-dependent methyltransferase [Thermoleophilaceae bacterium]